MVLVECEYCDGIPLTSWARQEKEKEEEEKRIENIENINCVADVNLSPLVVLCSRVPLTHSGVNYLCSRWAMV